MAGLKRALLGRVNGVVKNLGIAVIPSWEYASYITGELPSPSFRFGNREYKYFFHRHNCGFHPAHATERCVELALADCWLAANANDDVVEIGAVTPYYWPGRVRIVVDPADDSSYVTMRQSVLDVDLSGAVALCISTLEHVGSGEYGQPSNSQLTCEAFEKVLSEPKALFVTIPLGYNPVMDQLLRTARLPADVTLSFLTRSADGQHWKEERTLEPCRQDYQHGTRQCAVTVAVIERGARVGRDTRPTS
jgi:hypothetical protein